MSSSLLIALRASTARRFSSTDSISELDASGAKRCAGASGRGKDVDSPTHGTPPGTPPPPYRRPVSPLTEDANGGQVIPRQHDLPLLYLSLSLVRISIGAIATILDSLGFPTLQLFFSFSIGCDRKKSTILASVPLRADSIAYVALIRSPRQSMNHNRLYPISNIVSIQSIAAFWPSLSRSLQRHHQSDWTRCFSFYSNQIEFL